MLEKTLPKTELLALQKQIEEAPNFPAINQCIKTAEQEQKQSNALISTSPETKKHCTALLDALPPEEADALKNKLSECTSAEDVDQLVKETLPEEIQNAEETTQKNIQNLSHKDRAEIFEKLLNKGPKTPPKKRLKNSMSQASQAQGHIYRPEGWLCNPMMHLFL